MTRQPIIGHDQQQILATLCNYKERYPGQWVPHYRLNNDLGLSETTFSRAIKRLIEPHGGDNDVDPLVEMTYASIVYREYEGNVIPLADNATMSDALFAVKFAWDGRDGCRRFYRITELGVECFDSLTMPNRLKPTKVEASPSRTQKGIP